MPVRAVDLSAAMGPRPQDTETLYREHGVVVAALCRSLLRDRAEAEDATQQVFLSAHRAVLKGTTLREPLAWLLAVARNECYARFRQRAVAPVPVGDAPDGPTTDVSVHVLRAGELASVWDEVERMPAAQREAFLLREIRGLSYGQLAEELSLSTPSVRSLLLRARTRLRRRLGDVATLGGAPWLQSLFRLAGGGDGASPMPAATKAAAVGLGALALVGGGDMPRPAHHASAAPARPIVRHQAAKHSRHLRARTSAVESVPVAERSGADGRGSTPEPTSGRDGGSGSNRSGEHDGSGETAAPAPVAQPTTDGHDGGDGSATATATDTTTTAGSDDGSGSSGSDGKDGSATTTTTTTTTTTSGSDDGSGTSGSDGSGSSHDGHGG